MSELPPGWASTFLPVLVGDGVFSDGDWVESKDQDPEGDVRLVQLADVGNGEYRNRSARFMTRDKAEQLGCTFLQPGDILVARMPHPLGRACLFPGDEKECVTVVDVCIVRPRTSATNVKWLMHILNAPQMRVAVEALQKGTTRKRISRGNLAQIPIPTPPRPGQDRIVAAIEEQFSRLDAGVAALERARLNLKRMRAAVLHAAVTGWLVPHDANDQTASEWLALQGKQCRPTKALDLPSGWARMTIGELKTWSLYGPRFSSDDYVTSGVPVLRTTDITPNGRILVERAPKLALDAAALNKYRVRGGDVLITRTGSIGTVAYISDDGPAIPGAYLILYRFELPLEFSEFIFHLLQSPRVQSQLLGKSAGVGRPNLNVPSIDSIVIDVPPFPELHRILAEVKRIFSVLEVLESALSAEANRSNYLRSAILSTAFSGNLVPQDPGDEPSHVPLERIAADRASSDGRRLRKQRVKQGALL